MKPSARLSADKFRQVATATKVKNAVGEQIMKVEAPEHLEYVEEDDINSLNDAGSGIMNDSDDAFYTIKDVLFKSPFILPLTFFCNMGIIAYGYDNMVLSMVLSMGPFEEQYGNIVDGSFIIPAYWQSLWNALAQIGTMLGSVSTGYLKDTIGRKYTFVVGASISIIGVGVIYMSDGPRSYLAGKTVNAFGLGVSLSTGQTYISEISPSSFRGIGLGMYGIGLGLGNFIGSITSSHMAKDQTSNYCYKALFASQWSWAGIIFVIGLIIPETPYFYIKKHNYNQARKQLAKLHGQDNGVVEALLNDLIKAHNVEQVHASEKSSYMECFQGTNWRRTKIIMYCNGFNQMIGSTFIGNAAYFLIMAGLSENRATQIIQIGSGMGLVSTTLTIIAMSYFGRRTMSLAMCIPNVLIFLAMGICSCFSGAKPLLGVGFSLMLIFITLGPSVSPMMIIAAEVPNMRLRAKSLAIGFGFNYFFSTVMNVVVPYMFNSDEGNLGGKMGWIFFGLSLISLIVIFFEIPETKDRSFDQIAILFEEKTPVRKFSERVFQLSELEQTKSAEAADDVV